MNWLRRRALLFYQRCRIAQFRFFSDCQNVSGRPVRNQPVLLTGKGRIEFLGVVNLGVIPSPHFLSGYIHIEARYPESIVQIGDGVRINNDTTIISEGPGVFIGKDTLIGSNCELIDSDFHELHPARRTTGTPKRAKVVLGENVLLGSNVRVLKGVEIGRNSVIGNGSIVSRSIPENVVAVGSPARPGVELLTDSP
ncbi:MAG TPA: acyltransferase [Candidatus Dormibacteraeota bacterium]|nr:acyltransferase [Candidatus Dormibacteraeota bacterium]